MNPNEPIRDARKLGTPKMLVLGLQHMFAMFGATILVPILVQQYGLPAGEAGREALRQDRERARLYGVHTRGKWADLSRYDLTVDSGPLGIAGTVELLSQFVALKVMRRRSGGGGEP